MKLLSSIGAIKNRLTRVGTKEPLNFLSIVIIIALDIFVLWNIFQGLDFQGRQVPTPRQAVPSACMNFLDKKHDAEGEDWRKVENALEFKGGYYNKNQTSNLSKSISRTHNTARHNDAIIEPCKLIYNAATDLGSTSFLKSLFLEIEIKKRGIGALENQNRKYEKSYDTLLLESIAGQEEGDSITKSSAKGVKQDIEVNERQIKIYTSEIARLKSEIIMSREGQKLLKTVAYHQKDIEETFEQLKFWYPLKRLFFQMLFLIPLLVLFGAAYRFFVRHEKELLVLIFAHLTVVVSIPIIIEFFRLFLDLLPFHFFADFISLLEVLGLVALWNYILILFGLLIALLCIYLIQKKFLSRQRQQLKRISKSICCFCGIKLHAHSIFCYKCGEGHLKKCQHCQHLTFKKGLYCQSCGREDF